MAGRSSAHWWKMFAVRPAGLDLIRVASENKPGSTRNAGNPSISGLPRFVPSTTANSHENLLWHRFIFESRFGRGFSEMHPCEQRRASIRASQWAMNMRPRDRYPRIPLGKVGIQPLPLSYVFCHLVVFSYDVTAYACPRSPTLKCLELAKGT